MIGRMAKEYGMLPSEIANRATTYDLMVTDVLATYEHYQHLKSQGKLIDPSVYKFTDEELKTMLDKAKT